MLILILVKNNAIEVASDEVAQHDAHIYTENFKSMSLEECERNCQIVECICHTVSESADDEERNSKEKRNEASLACKIHRCSHEETAADAKETASECTGLEPEFKNLLCS